MVHHLVLCKTHPEIEDEKVEWIMRETRMRLLKIGEVRAIKCGKRVDAGNEWSIFFGADYESMDKMAVGHDDPVYQRFLSEVIAPHVAEQLTLSYEMEPHKDVRYS